MEIYKDNYPISRSIFLSLLDNTLTLQSYDSDDGFTEEKIITVSDLCALRKVMNVETNDDLFNLMRIRYSIAGAIDLFSEFLEKNKIEYQYHRFTD